MSTLPSSNTSVQVQAQDKDQTKYLLTFYVPTRHTTTVCQSLTSLTAAGLYPGNLYDQAFWTTRGTGQFRPLSGANPNIGTVGQVEKVEEDKVEILCVGREVVSEAVRLLREVHPYEVVPWFVVRGEDF